MRSRRIYIAEEDRLLGGRLKHALECNGFSVSLFDSGYPLVEMMDDWPDAFLIDIELPGVNGIEVCKWLKSHESSCDIPVIFIAGDSYLRTLAASAQHDDFVEKPLDPRGVIHIINRCINSQRR